MRNQLHLTLKGRYLVNIRRVSQVVALIFFFFLLINSGHLIQHSASTYNIFVVACLGISIFFCFRVFKNKRSSKTKKNIAFVIFFLAILFFLISLFLNILTPPEYDEYLSKHPDKNPKDVRQLYLTDLKNYKDFYEFFSVQTLTIEDTENKNNLLVKIYLPPVSILLNYFLLFGSLFLLLLFFFRRGNQKKEAIPSLIKKKFLIAFLILILIGSILFFSLINSESKNPNEYEVSASFFPTDFSYISYFIEIKNNLFLQLSSLLGVVTLISTRENTIGFGYILFFVFVTFLFGRVFCGWICPFGTLQQFVAYIKMKFNRRFKREKYLSSQKIKYIVLLILLVCALFTVNLTGFFDPISLSTKFFSTVLIPGVQYVLNSTVNILADIDYQYIKSSGDSQSGILVAIINFKEWVTEFLLYPSLIEEDSVIPTHFAYYIFNTILLFGILTLSWFITRFWCRIVCPLGALYGLFASHSLMRLRLDKEKCTSCGACERFCQGTPDVNHSEYYRNSECLFCFSCIKNCPEEAIDVSFRYPLHDSVYGKQIDLNKRQVLISTACGIGLSTMLQVPNWNRRLEEKLIRPPGALSEQDFVRTCIKCSECMKACPQNFLHPTLLEANAEGMFTPMGVAKLGYCQYTCNVCGQVCPTQAIRKLPLQEKQKFVIGLARVNRNTCLTYTSDKQCIVCEEHCPASPKAIFIRETEIVTRSGKKMKMKQIEVDPSKCIGCGICEYVCPVDSSPGIYVTNIQETRHPNKKAFIEGNEENKF